jgi:methyl-accepting chemotaxis protein
MLIPSFRNLKIRAKLVSVTLFLVLVPLLCISFLALDRFGAALRGAAEENLEHLVSNIYGMCNVQQEMVQNKLVSDLKVAWEILHRRGKEITLCRKRRVSFDAEPVHRRSHPRERAPLEDRRYDDHPGDAVVDEVRNLVGGTCTIFQRIEGDHLLRISTNVIGKDGRRATGTFIPESSPVTRAILAGKPYRGRAFVVDDWYITAYEPIVGKDGTVIGALYVGVKEQSAYSLREEIKSIKVGETGYVYIIDSKGELRIHPAREGANIIDSRDTSGFEYIRAMIIRPCPSRRGSWERSAIPGPTRNWGRQPPGPRCTNSPISSPGTGSSPPEPMKMRSSNP